MERRADKTGREPNEKSRRGYSRREISIEITRFRGRQTRQSARATRRKQPIAPAIAARELSLASFTQPPFARPPRSPLLCPLPSLPPRLLVIRGPSPRLLGRLVLVPASTPTPLLLLFLHPLLERARDQGERERRERKARTSAALTRRANGRARRRQSSRFRKCARRSRCHLRPDGFFHSSTRTFSPRHHAR